MNHTHVIPTGTPGTPPDRRPAPAGRDNTPTPYPSEGHPETGPHSGTQRLDQITHHHPDERPTRPCARGCTQHGKHTTTCNTTTCTGCQPRPATHGTLCTWDWTRLHGDIIDTPQLLTHLHHIAQPHPGRQGLERHRPSSRPNERTPLHQAWLDADEITQTLADWTTHIAQLRGLPGPTPTRTTTGGTYTDPDTHQPTYTPPRPLQHDPDQATTWLLNQLPWVAEQPIAVDLREDLNRLIGTARARYPTHEQGHHVQHIPCPRCDQQTLWHHPPTETRRTMQVTCTNPDCARVFNEDEWDRLRALVEHDAKKANR